MKFWTKKAPNPISRPDEYLAWLSQVCTIYNCLVPDVRQLVTFTYGTEWVLCKDKLTFPDPTEDGQWPATKSLINWKQKKLS